MFTFGDRRHYSSYKDKGDVDEDRMRTGRKDVEEGGETIVVISIITLDSLCIHSFFY